MMNEIRKMCPKMGRSDGWNAAQNSDEDKIDKALVSLIKSASTPEMAGFYGGIYSAYVTMTLNKALWKDIAAIFLAAEDWSQEDFEYYRREI